MTDGSQIYNQAPMDAWSLVHVGAGVAAGGMRVPFLAWLPATIVYELFEQQLESSPNNVFKASGPESRVNAVLDVLVALVGWWIGSRCLGGKR